MCQVLHTTSNSRVLVSIRFIPALETIDELKEQLGDRLNETKITSSLKFDIVYFNSIPLLLK